MILWLTGLPASGKTTLAYALKRRFGGVVVDGDEFRSKYTKHLGYSSEDRMKNIELAANHASLLHRHGHNVYCAFVTPLETHREKVREILSDRVTIVHVSTPLEVCKARDPKNLYKSFTETQVTGGYQTPKNPDFTLDLSRSFVLRDLDAIVTRHLDRLGVLL